MYTCMCIHVCVCVYTISVHMQVTVDACTHLGSLHICVVYVGKHITQHT